MSPTPPRRRRSGRLAVAGLAAGLIAGLTAAPPAVAQDEALEAASLPGPSDWMPVPAERNFHRIATVVVGGADESAAPEIVSASDDGTMLVYSDSVGGQVGFVDLTDPHNPVLGTPVPLTGEPTAVAVLGDHVLVGEVDAASTFDTPDGNLLVWDHTSTPPTPVRTIDLGGQPDSVAVAPSGDYAAVVIENERDEDEVVGGEDGALPQLPAGELIVLDTSDPDPNNWTTASVDLTGLAGANEPTDPEPEYVDINAADVAVVSLQENNAIAVVDLATATVTSGFSAGRVSLPNVDITEDDIIDFEGSIVRERQPDAVAWISDSAFATANEGDIPENAGTEGGDDGGSRGFTVFDTEGQVLFESGAAFEYAITAAGHFPLGRAENKGVEPEAVEFGTFEGTDLLVVGSERGNILGVYDITDPLAPQLRQLIPSGIGPEGVLALPERNLLVVANEDDEEAFSSLQVFEYGPGAPTYPQLMSGPDGDARWPIPWGAQSGLAASPTDADQAWSVSDSFYADSSIFSIDLSTTPATITDKIELVDGTGAQISVDLEGIAANADGSFWVATEGAVPSDPAEGSTPNLIHRVAADGEVLESIGLPESFQACWTASADDPANPDRRDLRFGFEGISVDAEGMVWVAQQREWSALSDCPDEADAEGTTNLWRYDPASGDWDRYPYTLDAPAAAGGWVGLSEVVAYGPGTLLVIERDNQLGPNAEVKRLYTVEVPDAPGPVTKGNALDLLPALEAQNGIVPDKVEGAMVTVDGHLWISTDNDGMDDAIGESLLINLGAATEVAPAGVQGYVAITEDGTLTSFGDAADWGASVELADGARVIDLVANRTGTGAWALDSTGMVHALGAAAEVGAVSTLGLADGESLVALVPRPQGDGAWVVTDRGRAMHLGAAPALAGLEGMALNAPIVDAIASPSGEGLAMVAPDGGVFTLGDAPFFGSLGDVELNEPIVAMAADPDGMGYWLFASDGGVFTFESEFLGSLGDVELVAPVFSGLAYGDGYVMAARDGGVFVFSDTPFEGSLGDTGSASPVAGLAAFAL